MIPSTASNNVRGLNTLVVALTVAPTFVVTLELASPGAVVGDGWIQDPMRAPFAVILDQMLDPCSQASNVTPQSLSPHCLGQSLSIPYCQLPIV